MSASFGRAIQSIRQCVASPKGVMVNDEPCRRTHASPPSETTQWAALPNDRVARNRRYVLVQEEFLKGEMRNDISAIIKALYDYLYHTRGRVVTRNWQHDRLTSKNWPSTV